MVNKLRILSFLAIVAIFILSGQAAASAEDVNVSLEGNVITIRGHILEETRAEVIKNIFQLLGDEKAAIIEIRLASSGGNVEDSLEICNAMHYAQKFKTVRTVAIGNAESCAAIILSAGTKGERYVGKYSCVMIHSMQMSASNAILDPKKVKEIMERYDKEALAYYFAMAENAGKSVEQIKEDCYNEKWMTSKEAIAYGLADKVW